MNPLILFFAEPCTRESLPDKLGIEYDDYLQLSVIKGTKIPAFDQAELRTETVTKADSEPMDEDRSNDDNCRVKHFMATMTVTRTQSEGTDKD